MFDDAGAVSQPLEESRFDDLKQYILESMKPVVEDRFRSSLPKIYGEAAKSEALALKRRQLTAGGATEFQGFLLLGDAARGCRR